MNLFFAFEDKDSEIQKKLISRKISAEFQFTQFCELFSKQGSADDAIKIKTLFNNVVKVSSEEMWKPAYLSHPIRVTASFLARAKKFDYETAALGLCHNLKELSPAHFKNTPEELLSSENRRRIELLTIDRAKEKDERYLKNFYDDLVQDETLLLLKAFDKLDNLLCYPLYDFEAYHGEIVLKHVCPRLASFDAELAQYLKTLTNYVEKKDVKEHYRQFDSSKEMKQQCKTFKAYA